MWARLIALLRVFLTKLRSHCAESFLPALCVASIVFVSQDLFYPLQALVFAEVANGVGYQELFKKTKTRTGHTATVISIDEASYANAYGEQAPLNRCQLHHHLKEIYAAEPAMLVVDIDLSPARWLHNAPQPGSADECNTEPPFVQSSAACQAQCQRDMYELLKQKHQTRTVLILPFGAETIDQGKQSALYGEWIDTMEKSGIRIADDSIVETLGIVLHRHRNPDSIASQACEAMQRQAGWRCVEDEHAKRDPWIDPRKYFSNISLLNVSQLAGQTRLIKGQAVFFGRASHHDDQFLTPVGTVNGVEIHAAAFLTLSDPIREEHLLTFMAELAIAIAFGATIDFCWRRYFHARFSSDASERLPAPLYVLALACLCCLVLWLAWKVSWHLLANAGVWASPIELAVGMLIEGWMRGSITGAVHESFALTHEHSPHLTGVLDSVKRIVIDVVNLWNKVDHPDSARLRIEARMRQLEREMAGVEATEVANARFRYRKAAILLGTYRLVFASAVAWCMAQLLIPNH